LAEFEPDRGRLFAERDRPLNESNARQVILSSWRQAPPARRMF
jgi:hypothetical protein